MKSLNKNEKTLQEFYEKNPQLRPENADIYAELRGHAKQQQEKQSVNFKQYKQRKARNKQDIKNEHAYWDNIEGRRTAAFSNKPQRKQIPYEQGKAIVQDIIRRRMEKQKRSFIFRDEGSNIQKWLKELTLYFCGQPGKLNPNKGLFIFGSVGTGKTMLIEVFQEFCERLDTLGYEIKNMRLMTNEVSKGGIKALDKYMHGMQCFDDVGAEKDTVHYGTPISPFEELINELDTKFNKTGKVAIATSNLMPQELASRYCERTASRCKQMFNFILLKGADKRGYNG